MKWILGIVGLLAANVIAMVILAVTANSGRAQVIPSYYDQALKYDDVLDEAARSAKLGWHVDAVIEHGVVTVTVRDAAGAPIRDANVRVRGYLRTHADAPFDLQGDKVALPTAAAGWYDLVVVVERGGDRHTRKLSVEAR